MVINTNLQAQISSDNLQATQARLSQSLARLSSGSKIVSPGDDAGGLAVASRLDSAIQRTNAANANVANAISFTQTQDSYLSNIAKAINRMSELAMLAQDGTKTDSDRALYNDEFNQLSQYIDQASNKDFNGVSLFSSNAVGVTIDADGTEMSMNGINLGASAYTNLTSSVISTTAGAVSAVSAIKAAITQLASDRALIGAYQSRLNYTSQQLTVSRQNLTAASSQIEDVDVANESTTYAKENVLLQAGTAMLAQANQLPQSVLKLLG